MGCKGYTPELAQDILDRFHRGEIDLNNQLLISLQSFTTLSKSPRGRSCPLCSAWMMPEQDVCPRGCTVVSSPPVSKNKGLFYDTPIGRAAREIQGWCGSLIALGPSSDRSVENDFYRAVGKLREALNYIPPWISHNINERVEAAHRAGVIEGLDRAEGICAMHDTYEGAGKIAGAITKISRRMKKHG